ncbi:MAG: hypothetical protein HGA80_07890, partial [Candidatus Omnitrophica bacterium]|nr:hypothetical protein [Candidatus Omnitrophota bacterium]
MSKEAVTTHIAGASLASDLAIAGSVSVVDINNTNQAYIKDSDVDSRGDLKVLAQDESDITTKVVVVAGSLKGAAGGSVAVNNIGNNTTAKVIGGDLNAVGSTEVLADSDESIDTLVGTGSIGLGLGVAGAVSVNTIGTTTEAGVGSSATRASSINQDARYQASGTFSPDETQTVLVQADDKAYIKGKGGAVGAGGVGIGATIDVGTINNRTVAQVGSGAKIYSSGDVDVLAVSDWQLTSITGALAGGLLGLSGAISVVSMGSAVDEKGADEFNGDLRGQVAGDTAIPDLAINSGDETAVKAKANVDALAAPDVEKVLDTGADTDSFVTAAYIASSPDAASRTEVVSGSDINVSATNSYDVEVDAGQLAVGAVGLGASVAVVSINNNTKAYLGAYNYLEAGDQVRVSAVDKPKAGLGASEIEVYSGNFGIVGAGGGYAGLDINNDTRAYLDDHSVIEQAKKVTVSAEQVVDASAKAIGAAGGLAAAGVLVADTTIGGTVEAYTGAARIGNSDVAGRAVNRLEVRATAEQEAYAQASASAGGVLAGNGSAASTTVDPQVSAFIGSGATVNVENFQLFTINNDPSVVGVIVSSLNSGDLAQDFKQKFADNGVTLSANAVVTVIKEDQEWLISDQGQTFLVSQNNAALNIQRAGDVKVNASAELASQSNAWGVSAGGVAVGVSLAVAEAVGHIQSFVGPGASLKAGHDVGILSQVNTNVDAGATASAGALIGLAGAGASASASPETKTYIGDHSTVNAGQDMVVQSVVANDVDAAASGKIGGIAAFGSDTAQAGTGANTSAYVGKNVEASVGNMRVDARATNDTLAGAQAGAGGGIAGVTARAGTNQTDATRAYIAGNDDDQSRQINASDSVTVWAENKSIFNSTVDSSAAGLVGLSGGNAYNSVESTVESYAGQNADIQAGDDIVVRAVNRAEKNKAQQLNLLVGAGGAFGGAAGESHSTIKNNTRAYVQGNASAASAGQLNAGRDIIIASANDVVAYDLVKLSSGGLVSGALAESGFDLDPSTDYGVDLLSETTVGDNASLVSGNDVNVSSKTDAHVEAIAYTRTWGLASIGDSKAVVELKTGNVTTVKDSADIYSGRDVHINAGMGPDSLQNVLFARADARSYVSGGIPISSVGGHAYLVDANLMDIQADAKVRAERDVNLGAYRGSTFVQGYAQAKKRSYAFFGIPITVYSNGSRVSSFNGLNSILVNGYVESGLKHLRSLTIKGDAVTGAVSSIDGDIDFTQEDVNTRLYYATKRKQLEDDIAACQAGTCKQLALQLELDRYPKLDDIAPDATFTRITIKDTEVSSGDINLNGVLAGSGTLKAPGNDFRIQIENESLAHLEINDLEISKDVSGRIVLNGQDINHDAYPDLVELPAAAAAEINIFNSRIQELDTDPVSDIVVVGNIVNLVNNGSVNIKNNSGSIETFGNVLADNINIRSAGDFSHHYTTGRMQTNGTSGTTPLIAGRNIYISAQIIDITGTVQSGVANRYMTIPEGFDPHGTRDSAGKVPWLKRVDGRDNVLNLYANETDIWGTQAVWDEENQRIKLDPVRITGGSIELFGEIVNSTGRGELKVIDGFGNIDIVNNSNYDIEINQMNTGSEMHGSIRIIDAARQNPEPVTSKMCEPLVTDFSRDDKGLIHTAESYMYLEKLATGNYEIRETPTEDNPGLLASRSTTYQPLNGNAAVKIIFEGSDTPGSIHITNRGGSDILLNRSISNQAGNVVISNAGGDISALNGTALISGRDINFSAGQGAVGTVIQPIRLDTMGGVLNVFANGLVHLQETKGDLTVGSVRTSGDIRLLADGALKDTSTNDASIQGDIIALSAGLGGNGSIGTADNVLTIDSLSLLQAKARDGIYLEETAGDVHVDQLSSEAGDVFLEARNGAILDANLLEAETQERLDALTARGEELELEDTADPAQMEALAASMQNDLATDKQEYIEQQTARYRSDHVLTDPEIEDIKVKQKAAYAEQYRDDKGTADVSDDTYRDGYDPNWSYVLTQDDIDAKADRIAAQKKIDLGLGPDEEYTVQL